MQTPTLKIINGKILTPQGILSDHILITSEGEIKEITTSDYDLPGSVTIDAKGNYISPGCIDIHNHGGGGHDFLEATPEAFNAITEAHARYGMTAVYPTLAAYDISTFYQAIEICEQQMKSPAKGARVMGLHLEGNYLNPIMKGGQFESHLYPPKPEEYKALLDRTNCIKRWSASPELAGVFDFARYATENGVLVSLAHTVADYPVVKAAYDAGFTHVTHFYNAMTGVHKVREFKHEGTIESIYLIDEMTVELVADGIHVPPTIMKLVHKMKGTEKVALVTDAMKAAAWPEAETEYNDPDVIIEDGVGKLADRSALSSSIATADRMIRSMMKGGASLQDAVRMASETPARIMGILDQKGTLEQGKDADIIIFDQDINIQYTIVEGNIVYH